MSNLTSFFSTWMLCWIWFGGSVHVYNPLFHTSVEKGITESALALKVK